MYVYQVVDGIVTGKRTASVSPSIVVDLGQDGHVRKHVALSCLRAGRDTEYPPRASPRSPARTVPSALSPPRSQVSPPRVSHAGCSSGSCGVAD